MAKPQSKVLAIAASQIGYSRWNDPNRGTKYAREAQPVFWPRDYWLLANGISFCDIGITWVFWKAFGKQGSIDVLPAQPSYNTDYRASKGGRISKSSARPGDVLVFDWNWNTRATNHVGILEKRLSGSRFQTIEFNTSPGSGGSQGNGGGVYRRVRRHNQVRYVIRPRWSKAGGTTGALEPWEKSKRIRTMPVGTIKGVQRLLVDLGYDIGSYGVDGSYKADTYNAVKKAQKALGVTVDGVAGPDTIAAMKKAGGSSKPKPSSKPSKPAKKQNVVVDSRFGRDTVKVFMKYLVKFHPDTTDLGKDGIDGKAGHDFWKSLQRAVGTPVDGKVSNQSHPAKSLGNGITQGWEYTGPNSSGSKMVRQVQEWAGVKADGVWGEKTSKAVQEKLNTYDLG